MPTIPSLLPTSNGNLETKALLAAEAAVRRYCGWHIAPVITQTIVVDGSGSRSLFLPSLKVLDITALSVCGDPVDVEELEWSENGFIRARRYWPDRLRSVMVTFEHGYDEVPEVAELIETVAARHLASPAGIVREQAGGISVTFAQTGAGVAGGVVLMAHEKSTLDKYRLSLRGA